MLRRARRARAGPRRRRVKSRSRSPSTSWARTPAADLACAGGASTSARRHPQLQHLAADLLRPPGAGGRPRPHDAALVHDHQAVAELGRLVHVVRRQDQGGARGCAAARRRSQTACRAWGSRPVVGSSSSTSRGWLMRARAICRRRRIPPESASTASSRAVVQRQQRQQLDRARRAASRPRDVEVAGVDQQVLAHGELEVQRRLLGHHAQAPLERARLVARVEAQHPQLAGVARRQAREHPHGRGLAGAVRAEEAEALARARSPRSMPSTAVNVRRSAWSARGPPTARGPLSRRPATSRPHGGQRQPQALLELDGGLPAQQLAAPG